MLLRSLLVVLCARAALAVCPNDCSGHGACNMYSMCECYRNFMGADCSQRVCNFGLAFVDTPQGDLNADGYVSGSTFESQAANTAASGGWEVYPWYAGWGGVSYTHNSGLYTYNHDSDAATSDITVAVGHSMTRTGSAQGEAHLYKECSAKGSCNRGTGMCECFAGYEGEACGRTACPNDCSGHGVCTLIGEDPEFENTNGSWGPAYTDAQYTAMGLDGTTYVGWDRWSTQSCTCDAGFFGEDCSLRACPKGDDPVTKYNAYTRIKLIDDTAASWYDTAACPTGTALPTESTVAVSCANAGQALDIDGDDTDVELSCVVTTAGVGYDSEYGLPVPQTPSVLNDCGAAPTLVIFEFDEAGNIPVGSYVHMRFATEATGASAGCNKDGTFAMVFSAPVSGAAANGYRRSRAGLLPTRVWTWEDPTHDEDNNAASHNEHVLSSEKYIWSAWYSPYDAAATTEATAVKGPAARRTASGSSWADEGYATAAARCYYEADASTSCKYNPVKYATDGQRTASVAYQQVATVTGMASMASGVITDACCSSATGKDCSSCNFFDILLKDVEGTFNTGDELRVSWPTLSNINARASGGFALCNYIESISTYYAANAQNYQQNEVQVLQIQHHDIAKFDGYFALEFTDEMGDTWTTEAVSVTGGHDLDNTATATLSSAGLAARIEDALEALPNNVLPDVDVDFYAPEQNEDDSEITRHFTISFVANTGDIPTLGVAYSVVDEGATTGSGTYVSTNSMCGGYTHDFRFPSDCTCTTDATANPNTKLTAMACGDKGYGMFDFTPVLTFTAADTITMTTLDGRLDTIVLSGTGTGHTASQTAADCVTALGLKFGIPEGTDFAPDVAGLQDSDYFRERCMPVDSAVDIFVTSVDTVTAGTGTFGPGDHEAGRVTVLEEEDMPTDSGVDNLTPRDGTTENVECSNRGICDYSTGVCKCFTGFTTEDCSVQDSLAMG